MAPIWLSRWLLLALVGTNSAPLASVRCASFDVNGSLLSEMPFIENDARRTDDEGASRLVPTRALRHK